MLSLMPISKIRQLVSMKAKKEKDYTKADEIRNFLKEKGIELIDQSKEITTWIRV